MPLVLAGNLETIGLSQLQTLVGVAEEDKTLEFKESMKAKTREEVNAFLEAVTSFANTVGGDLVIGIKATKGVAVDLVGVELGSLDDEKLRLEDILASGVEPRLPPVAIRGVAVSDGRWVLVVRVGQSWLAPHRVKPNQRFYRRTSAGSYPLDVSELRSAFVQSDSVAAQARAFRTERVDTIESGPHPVSMHWGPKLIIHVVPFSTLASGAHLDIVSMVQNGTVMPLPPKGVGTGNQAFVNLDGMGVFSYGSPDLARGYSLAFRNGAVEGVQTLYGGEGGEPYLVDYFEEQVLGTIRNYLMFEDDLKLGHPIIVFLSFVGMKDCRLKRTRGMQEGTFSGPLGRDRIELQEVVVTSPDVNLAKAMRVAFNTIWNGYGYMGSPTFDSAGEWAGGDY